MDYTKSLDYATHAATGQRLHEDNQATPTVVSDDDLNALAWELLALIKGAGLTPTQFDRDVSASYQQVLTAVRAIAWGAGKTAAPWAPSASPVLTGTPTTPTPAPLSNTQSIINGAYLWSATNGQKGVDVTTTGTYTLSDTDANNRVIYFFGTPTSNSTIVFPTSQQRDYLIINLTTYDHYVKLVGQSDYVVIPADRRKIIYCTASKVNDFFTNVQLDGVSTAPTASVGTRTAQLATTNFVGNEIVNLFGNSLVSNGWQKLGNGLILQWGAVAITNAAKTLAYLNTGTIGSFPISFPNACLRMVSSDTGGAGGAAAVVPIDKATFRIWGKDTSGTCTDQYNFQNYTMQYLAIGY